MALAVKEEYLALSDIVEQADEYARKSKAESTQRAYRSDWRHFEDWCIRHRLQPLPANVETVRLYLVDLARDYKPATLQRRIAAISVAHKLAGYHESPTQAAAVRVTMQGIKRDKGTSQRQAAAVRARHLRQAIPQLPDTLQGKRDKALLLLGLAGALRRSELVALNVEDLQFTPEGLQLLIRKSKTDQEGRGNILGIGCGMHGQTCPVKALQEWLQAASITAGPVFRPINRHGQIRASRLSDKSVSEIIKRLAPLFGLEASAVSGHSLRAGFITDQYQAGTAEQVIMHHTRHKSTSVMGRYRRESELFSFNYTAAVGL